MSALSILAVATGAAAPILKDASKVAILRDPEGLDNGLRVQADPKRVTDYLRGHGVAVDTVINVRGRKIGPTLLQGAADFGAGLLVAGAYRHSRLQEAIFGGATQTFLSEANGPICSSRISLSRRKGEPEAQSMAGRLEPDERAQLLA